MATSGVSTEQADADRDGTPPLWRSALAILIWAGLWYLTPGLHAHGVGVLLADAAAGILLETAIALVVVVGIALLQRQRTAALFARDRQVWMYALPVVLAIALPFHYTLPLPVGVYMLWMAVSVLWQDYLTFGLLQSHLRDRLPAAVTIPLVAFVFYLGHAVLIPELFAPTRVLPAVGILAMGVVCAAIRERTGMLHLLLALHLGFYFVFA